MDLGLSGKIVAVTGAARGLGRAAGEAFLAEGARVLFADRSFPEGWQPANGGRTGWKAHVADVSTEGGAAGVVRAAVDAFGSIDILVCNAGRHSSEAVVDVTAEAFEATIATNVGGALYAIREAARCGLDGGAVVIIGSTATKSVQPNEFSYRASKMALRALAESAALELSPRGIRVNLVTPGAIDTEFAPRSDRRRQATAQIPMQREGQPAEIANVVVFLASKAASYVTGAEFLVDGGLSMRPLFMGAA